MIFSYMSIESKKQTKLIYTLSDYDFYIIKGQQELYKSKIIKALANRLYSKDVYTELILSSYDNLPVALILHKFKTVIINTEYIPHSFTPKNVKMIINIKQGSTMNNLEEIKISKIYINELKVKLINYINALSSVENELESHILDSLKQQKVERFIKRTIPLNVYNNSNQLHSIRYSPLTSDISINKPNNICIYDKYGAVSSNIIKNIALSSDKYNSSCVIFMSQLYRNKFDGIYLPNIDLNITSVCKDSDSKNISYKRFIDFNALKKNKNKIYILYKLKCELLGEYKKIISNIQKFSRIINSYYSDNYNDSLTADVVEKIISKIATN